MPKNYSQDEVQAQLKKLPQVLKDALFDADIAEKIYEIGKNSGLTINKIGLLAQETGDITLGFSKPTDLIKNLSESLGIDENKAREIAGRINHEVFLPLRDALKSTHQFDISGDTIQRGESAVKKPIAMSAAPEIKKPDQRIGREPVEEHELTPKAPPPATTFRPRPVDTAQTKPPAPASTQPGFLSPSILHPLQSKPPIEVKPSITPPKLPPNVVIGIPQRPATSAPRPEAEQSAQTKSIGEGTAPSWAVKPIEKPTPPVIPQPAPQTAASVTLSAKTSAPAATKMDEAMNLESEIKRALEGLNKDKVSSPAAAPAIPPVIPPAIPPSPQTKIPEDKPSQISPAKTPEDKLSQILPNKISEDKPIDLRSQYKPIIPPHSPKVPPINLREQGIKNNEPYAVPPQIPKSPLPVKPPETIKIPVAPPLPPPPIPQPSPAPASKISPPIDAIANKPVIEASPVPKAPAGEAKPAASEIKTEDKKMPSSGLDKYREPIE